VRLVLDTNTIISGLIRGGSPPRRLLEAAASGAFELISSEPLLVELLEVLRRDKFASRLLQAGLTADAIVADIRRLAITVTPTVVPRVVKSDPDDDHVIAAALAGGADLIVSGDKALLAVRMFQSIQIVTAADAVSKLGL
jgi:uncharacterized protein